MPPPDLKTQLDLFAPRSRKFDEAALIRRLEAAAKGATPSGQPRMSPAANKRLMTPLPRITAFD